MQGLGAHRFDPELKQIIREASRGLALLDVDGLEELARSCQLLNNIDLEPADAARQARDAAGDMAVFARVLGATRTNLDVISRLRDLRQGSISYANASPRPSAWMLAEAGHGDD